MDITKLIQLKPHEEILETVHETRLTRIPISLLLVVLFALPFFFLFPLFQAGLLGMIIFFVLFFFAIVCISHVYLTWSRTMLIVTDQRVIDIEQKGLFDRVVTEASFDQIAEVSYRMKGILPTLFRFGTIFCGLNGNAADIEFRRVRSPERIQDLINDLRHETQNES